MTEINIQPVPLFNLNLQRISGRTFSASLKASAFSTAESL